jgi:hypothetical protein
VSQAGYLRSFHLRCRQCLIYAISCVASGSAGRWTALIATDSRKPIAGSSNISCSLMPTLAAATTTITTSIWLLDRATDAVLRDAIRVLVIDPWNEIERARRRDETTTDYIGRCIRALKRFARLYDVVVIIVAHPTTADAL